MREHILNFFRFILFCILMCILVPVLTVTWPFSWVHEKVMGFTLAVLGLDEG